MRHFVLCAFVALAACTGAEGPMGPQGDPGPGTRQVYNGTVGASGAVFIDLPAAAGTIQDLPALTCYISSDGSAWLVVATDFSTSLSCGLSDNPDNTLYVGLVNAPPGYLFRLVVVY